MPYIDKIIANSLEALPLGGRELALHIMSLQGKRMRPTLLVLTAAALGFDFLKKGQRAYSLAAAVEFVHCASLLHDDIQDDAPLRRGHKAAHLVFGAKNALLAGDALLALATTLVARGGNKKITICMSDAVLATVCGQMQELVKKASLASYTQAIAGKTGSLMAVSTKLGALLAGADAKMCKIAEDLGLNLGIAFQLADDWLDFFPPQITGKARAVDLAQANFTLPIRFFADMLGTSERKIFYQNFLAGRLSKQEQLAICESVLCFEIQNKMIEFSEQYLAKAQKCVSCFPNVHEAKVVEHIITNIRQSFRGHLCLQN